MNPDPLQALQAVAGLSDEQIQTFIDSPVLALSLPEGVETPTTVDEFKTLIADLQTSMSNLSDEERQQVSDEMSSYTD